MNGLPPRTLINTKSQTVECEGVSATVYWWYYDVPKCIQFQYHEYESSHFPLLSPHREPSLHDSEGQYIEYKCLTLREKISVICSAVSIGDLILIKLAAPAEGKGTTFLCVRGPLFLWIFQYSIRRENELNWVHQLTSCPLSYTIILSQQTTGLFNVLLQDVMYTLGTGGTSTSVHPFDLVTSTVWTLILWSDLWADLSYFNDVQHWFWDSVKTPACCTRRKNSMSLKADWLPLPASLKLCGQ